MKDWIVLPLKTSKNEATWEEIIRLCLHLLDMYNQWQKVWGKHHFHWLDFPSYSRFPSNCNALQLWIKLCFVSGSKHIRWSIIGHRFRDDSICSSHLNRVQARSVQGLVRWGIYTPDSPGTSRWLRGWPSMAVQSAAVIQGGPTSSYQQVVSFIMRSLSKTPPVCIWAMMLYRSAVGGELWDFLSHAHCIGGKKHLIANENEASK